jgi:lambda family phage portal protein
MANPLKAAARSLEIVPTQRRGVSTFGGASTSRLYSDWWAGNFSPDFETRGVRRIMRARARQLVRDNAYAQGFITEVANNVVGPTGIRLRAEVSTLLEELHKKTNAAIEDAWADWCLPDNASADRHDSFIDLEKLIIQTIAMDGECFIRKRRYFRNAHGFALQIIDADQVDDFYTMLPSPGQNEIRSGVEIDEYGAPLAYHIWRRHISDSGHLERMRVPADEIIHLFVRYRPNQSRGITWFAPVMTSVKMYDGLTEAELVASRAAAAKMGFIVQKNPLLGTSGINPDDDPEEERLMEAAAGTLDYLGPGEEIQTFDPQHPNAMFKDFTKTILRGVARGLGVSYTALTGDLEGVNYSSIRWGMLAERDNWKALQNWYSTQFHRRVYGEWVSMALLTGALVLDSRLASDYSDVTWRPRGWAWVDPLKDIQARVLGIQHGMDSRTEAIDEEGGELEDTFSNLKKEQDLAKEYGIEINPVAPPRANSPMGVPSQTDNEEANPNQDDPNQNALSEDDRASIWAAAQIAANDTAAALGKRGVKVRIEDPPKPRMILIGD